MKEEVYVDIVYIKDIRCDVEDIDEVDKENEVDKRMG